MIFTDCCFRVVRKSARAKDLCSHPLYLQDLYGKGVNGNPYFGYVKLINKIEFCFFTLPR